MGKIFIVCAPSGAGKTSITRQVIANDPKILLSLSHTTRSPRSSEKDGADYFFVSENKFQELSKNGMFIETAKVYGNYYGTSKKWVDDTLSEGFDILLEIDPVGAQQIKSNLGSCTTIFILPPSKDELKSRLVKRERDSKLEIKTRLSSFENEINHLNEFDYVIINSNLNDAVNDLITIVRAERLKITAQSQIISNILD
ncbi:MAG: guanylate kinase [Proteobacteria bacterium]|nr:guanylate kinase [Pseudomonadota bacterium]